MSNTESLQLFEDQPIRSAWDEEAEEWYFSIVDVVGVLTEQPDARHASTYWAVLKKRLNEGGASELLTKKISLFSVKKKEIISISCNKRSLKLSIIFGFLHQTFKKLHNSMRQIHSYYFFFIL